MRYGLSEEEWQAHLVAYLRAEMLKKGIGFSELSALLQDKGVTIERVPLATKVRRGTFNAGFLLLLLSVLDCQSDWLADVAKSTAPDTESGTEPSH